MDFETELRLKRRDYSQPGDIQRVTQHAAGVTAYCLGIARRSDTKEAFRLFEMASNYGDKYASMTLWHLLKDSSPDDARTYLERAADGGHSDAAMTMARMLIKTDAKRSRHYMKLAMRANVLAK